MLVCLCTAYRGSGIRNAGASLGPSRSLTNWHGHLLGGEWSVTCVYLWTGQGPTFTMVKLGCSFSGKPGKDPGDQDGATTDSVPLISPLDVSQLQPPFPDQVSAWAGMKGSSQSALGIEGSRVSFI